MNEDNISSFQPAGVREVQLRGINGEVVIYIVSGQEYLDYKVGVSEKIREQVSVQQEKEALLITGRVPIQCSKEEPKTKLAHPFYSMPEINIRIPNAAHPRILKIEETAVNIIDNALFSNLVLFMKDGSYETPSMLHSLDCVAEGGNIAIEGVNGEIKRIIASGNSNIKIESVSAPEMRVEVSGNACVVIPYYGKAITPDMPDSKGLTVIVKENGKATIEGRIYTAECPEGKPVE